MSADRSFTSPTPCNPVNDTHICPPPPHAHKSSISFCYGGTYLTISASTDSDDDVDNSVDHTHTNDTKDDTPLFFPKSSSILGILGTNVSSTEVKYSHAHTMMRNRPEASFTLKKRKRVSPEIRLPTVQFPVLPLYPEKQKVPSSSVEQIPRCKSEPFKTKVITSLPPNRKQRRRTSIARCA